MDDDHEEQIVCKHCFRIFSSKSKCDHYVRLLHQNEVNIRHPNGPEILIHRFTNGKFICICNKGYDISQSLLRHQKDCHHWNEYIINQEVNLDSESSLEGNIHIIILTYRNFIA